MTVMDDRNEQKPRPTNTSAVPPIGHLLDVMLNPNGFIEASEARGQQELLASDVLPVEMNPSREAFEAVGFKFGEPVQGDELFLEATLPTGWQRQGSDHSMWTYIVDETGRQRVSIFYKAAFYDRSAFMRIED